MKWNVYIPVRGFGYFNLLLERSLLAQRYRDRVLWLGLRAASEVQESDPAICDGGRLLPLLVMVVDPDPSRPSVERLVMNNVVVAVHNTTRKVAWRQEW